MLLDSDVVVDGLRNHPPALAWLRSLPVRPLVSGFAALEAAFGARNAVELANVRTFRALFPVLWPDAADVERGMQYARLHLTHGTEVLDALTAALAIGHGLAVATFNVRHFRAVPGLSVVQPYNR